MEKTVELHFCSFQVLSSEQPSILGLHCGNHAGKGKEKEGRTQEGCTRESESDHLWRASQPAGPANGPHQLIFLVVIAVGFANLNPDTVQILSRKNKKAKQANIGIFLCKCFLGILALAFSQEKHIWSKKHHPQPGPATCQCRGFLILQAGVKKIEIGLVSVLRLLSLQFCLHAW